MPRYPITEQEVEDMRRSGIPAPVQRDEQGRPFIMVTSSDEDNYSDSDSSEERVTRCQGTGADVLQQLLNPPEPTEDERVEAILNGDMAGVDLENLSEREEQALQTFVDELAVRAGIVSVELPRRRQAHFSIPQEEPQPNICVQPSQPPQPNLLQVQPEEIDQDLLELAFADAPEVDINTVMQLLAAPGDPGDPNPGSVTVNEQEEKPPMRNLSLQGRKKKTKKRKSKRRTRKTKKNRRKRKSKRIVYG